MTQFTTNFKRQLVSRLSLVLLAVLGFGMDAGAENKVTIEAFSLKGGEEKTVAVNLDNEDPMSALQLDITLDGGLTYVDKSVTRNDARLDRDTHSIQMVSLGGGRYRLVVLPSGKDNIMGNSGAVAYFKVEAPEVFTGNASIFLNNIYGSNSVIDPGTGVTSKFEMEASVVGVYANVGEFYFTEETLDIKNDGSSKKISIALKNNIDDVRGMQGTIALPEGMSFETKANGKPKFEYGERLPQNMSVSCSEPLDGKLKFVVSGLTEETFAGNDGVVFSFFVKGSETLAETTEVTLSDVVVSDNVAHSLPILGTASVAVTNTFAAYLTPANEVLNALRATFEVAVEKINTEAADVKDDATVADAMKDIEERIGNLQQAVDEAYANETLAENYDAVLAPVSEIEQAVSDMVESALALQQKVTANEEAYTRLTAEIAAVQEKLDAAKTKIETEYQEVAERFVEDIAAGQGAIDALSADVKARYEAVELNAESTIDVASIETKIAEIVEAARIAHEEWQGVSDVKMANGAKVVGIYTVSGKCVAVPVKGQINIFKYSDGTVKKVYTK